MANRNLAAFAVALSLTGTNANVYAQSIARDAAAGFPSRPIRLVLLVAPGGGSDSMARTIAPRLTDNIGQQVLGDNRPGAGGIIGGDIAAKATPDGYTIMLATVRHSVNPSIY